MSGNTVWFLSGDLMFGSRVQAAANAAGLDFKMSGGLPPDAAGDEDSKDDEAHPRGPQLLWIILDLATRGSLLPHVYESGRQRFPEARWLAFGPHVQVAKLKAARQAGIGTVITRGQFDAALPSLFADRA